MNGLLPTGLLLLMALSAFAMIYGFISVMFVNRRKTRPEHSPTWIPFLVSAAIYLVSLTAYLFLAG